MANVSVTNTLVNGQVADASQVNTNFSDLVSYINNRNDASATWDALRVTTSSVVPAIFNNSTGANAIAQFQDNGSTVVSIGDGGVVDITTAAGVPLTVDNSSGANSIFIAQDNNSAVFTIANGGNITATGVYLGPAGAVGAPTISFSGNSNTGIYNPAANQLSISCGGTQIVNVLGTGVVVTGALVSPTAGTFALDGTNAGSVATPTYSFPTDLNTGMYRPSADTIGLVTGGTERLRITSGGQSLISDGTAALPALSFLSDTDTGIYRYGANAISLATAGNECIRFNAATAALSTDQEADIVSGPNGIQTIFRNRATADVTTSAVKIATVNQICGLVFITGSDGSNSFGELVFTANSVATPVVVASRNLGSPSARTYTQSTTELRLQMASGTYDVTAFLIEQRGGIF